MRTGQKKAQGTLLFEPAEGARSHAQPLRQQLLKWIGNKQRFAPGIVSHFPAGFGTYFEPFLGSAAVLATLAPKRGIASDVFAPLVEIWQTLKDDPAQVKEWYSSRWFAAQEPDRVSGYERIKASYNAGPNGADLLYLCRACYGGVVRFRKADGYMSTPCGVHKPIPPAAFAKRADAWHARLKHTRFLVKDFREVMDSPISGDLVYCDPPYKDSQAILYGAQGFDLAALFDAIRQCKSRGVFVALSIDGTKKTGIRVCDVNIPPGLFEREVFVNCGRSMLRRFQMGGRTLEGEVVSDRLLLTY